MSMENHPEHIAALSTMGLLRGTVASESISDHLIGLVIAAAQMSEALTALEFVEQEEPEALTVDENFIATQHARVMTLAALVGAYMDGGSMDYANAIYARAMTKATPQEQRKQIISALNARAQGTENP